MAEPRYVIIHGHFYQPPRESPWTGLTSPEYGAAPFQNWNERILSECYTANAHAHAMEGSVVHVRNNYETLNFDLGPTLAGWLQVHGKTAYRAMTRGDALSAERRGGRGNAIAQSYNHSILPLLAPRDRELQIAWGIDDFVYRYGRKPSGMWLPECAADEDTLASVASAGLEFVLLGADQGIFGGAAAENRSAGPFIWRDGGGHSLAVFRFDRELSNTISFGDGLADGARLAEWIAATALSFEPGAALMLATDGETFGHHHKHGAAELARALIMLERRDDIVLTNCADYLAAHPAQGSFEMRSASSWSCPHGVERWRSNCGCRLDANTSQEWRGPFRSAMEFVKNHIEATYDRFAPALVKEPQSALRDGIRMLIDPNPAVQDETFRRLKIAEPNREGFLRMLEMVRAGQAALTSCAWFFDDFAGLEGRVALRWAARAVELASEHSASVESELLERLREIHSNRRENGDAATLYLSLKTREARSRV